MALRVFFVTDLHLRISEAAGLMMPFSIPDADVCVLTGDISDRMLTGMEWVAGTIGKRMPVVMTLGNHDLYGQDMVSARRKAPARARNLGIHLLDDSEVVIDGVRFLGGTLWTDFRLFESLQDPVVNTQQVCMASVRNRLADYDEIYANEVVGGIMSRSLTPKDTVGYHKATVEYLDAALSVEFEGPTVVATHFAPYPRSIHQRYLDSPSSAAYASDLGWLIEKHAPEFWMHGHVHDSFDYEVGATRIICNPRGYATFPNPSFDPGLVIPVERRPRPSVTFEAS